MLSTLWKKLGMTIFAIVMAFAIIAEPVKTEAAPKPKLSYTKTVIAGKTVSIKIKNVKKGYYYKVTKTSGAVTTTPKVKKAKKITGKTATVKAVSKKVGTYKVTIQVYKNKKATKKVGKAITATIKVKSPASKISEPSSLKLTGTSLYVGEQAKVTATLTNATSANNSVTFKSENPEIATIDDSGNVTGIKAGEARIVATSGNLTAYAYVTVLDVNLNLESSEFSLYAGEQVRLKDVLKVVPVTAKVTFKSENPEIASVDDNGYVTAIKAGTTNIIVTSGNSVVTAKVIVLEANIELIYEKVGLGVGDEGVNLRDLVNITPVTAKVIFKSENPEIATVDANGNVTAVKEGRTRMFVISGSNSVTIEVVVEDIAPPEVIEN